MENEIVQAGEVRYDLTLARAPKQVLAEAIDASKALKSVVSSRKDAVKFNGKQYLTFEDYQTLGRFYGVTAKIISTELVEFSEVRGFLAKAEAVNTQTGAVVSAAEAMCLNDEPNWAKKPLFQLRSMAQTRAAGKSLRNVLAWVAVLAGYDASLAEEMTGDEGASDKPKIADPKPKAEAKAEAPKESGETLYATFIPASRSTKPTTTGKEKWAIKSPDGKWFSTLDKATGEKAVAAGVEKKSIKVGYVVSGDFLNIVSVEDASNG